MIVPLLLPHYYIYRWDSTLNSAIEECKKKELKAGESVGLAKVYDSVRKNKDW